MVRKLIASLVLASVLVSTSARPVAAVNSCPGSTIGNYHIIVARNADDPGIPGTWFDLARGEVTPRDLDVCVGIPGARWDICASSER